MRKVTEKIAILALMIGFDLLFSNIPACAQASDPATDMAFDDITNFSATATIQIHNSDGGVDTEIMFHCDQLNGKTRSEPLSVKLNKPEPSGYLIKWKTGKVEAFELTGSFANPKKRGKQLAALALGIATPGQFGDFILAQSQGQTGLPHSLEKTLMNCVSFAINRPDEGVTHHVYPNVNGYFDTPLTNKPAIKPPKYKIEQFPDETINDHSCKKTLITMISGEGQEYKLYVWSAVDMEKFPIQMKVVKGKMTIISQFSDIQIKNPDPILFELPDNCVQFKNQTEIESKIKASIMH